MRVRVARACDEEDFRDCVTGEGMGCVRGDNLVSGSPGRGGFGKWGRLMGRVCVRRHMVSVWVHEGVPGDLFRCSGSGRVGRGPGSGKDVLESSRRWS